MHRVVGLTFFELGVVLATTALLLSRQHQPPLDHNSLANCISDTRYRRPLADLHQGLVNDLYACGMSEVELG